MQNASQFAFMFSIVSSQNTDTVQYVNLTVCSECVGGTVALCSYYCSLKYFDTNISDCKKQEDSFKHF